MVGMSHSWVRALSARKKNFVLGLCRRKTISLPHTLEPRNSLGSTSAVHNCDEFTSILGSLLIGTASRDRNCCRSFSCLRHCIVEDTGEVRKVPNNKLSGFGSSDASDGDFDVSPLSPVSDNDSEIGKAHDRYRKPIDFTKVKKSLLPTVVIIGRPNVGKSALFNRAGLHPLDMEVGKWLRKHAPGIKLVVALNKAESSFDGRESLEAAATEVYRLGFGIKLVPRH